jgi:monoamine oxidase
MSVYDTIILGGGIAGLHTAYQILSVKPESRILLLEKTKRFGGRVHTFYDTFMTAEAGAGRVSEKHVLFMKLLRELKMFSLLQPTGSDGVFFASGPMEELMDGSCGPDFYFDKKGGVPENSLTPKLRSTLNQIHLDASPYSLKKILLKVIAASYLDVIHDLRKISFLDYARKIVSEAEVKHIEDSFGYYSELVIMNAHDSIQLMKQLSPNNHYSVLKGGFSRVIDALEKKILSYPNVRILLNHEVRNLKVVKARGLGQGIGQGIVSYQISCRSSGGSDSTVSFLGKTCVFALPKQVLERIPFFRPIKDSLLKPILCAPLCRIYSVFDTSNGGPWFKGLPKLTTNNPLRMVIPISEKDGLIMISYTDNKYALYWKKLLDRGGIREVNRWLVHWIRLSTGVSIPVPKDTHVFFWDCGVGYWGVGSDSADISKRVIQPFPEHDVFICGEHFSQHNQQWMEGALETSAEVVKRILL